ncbi:unnamed protein product [Heligmosomoides polygyrus]|uniref:Uncharacterized protein n=1 Tax=Heligmosomoides polygyrus TaxID=6339 RepID=A0A183FND4_HELPZ|nr:unnamed protein product [Heligmosomoides polygyrus]
MDTSAVAAKDLPFRDGSVESTPLTSLTGANQATPPPPPPGIPYNSVAAGRIAASSSITNTGAPPTTSPGSSANTVNAKTTVIASYVSPFPYNQCHLVVLHSCYSVTVGRQRIVLEAFN